MAGEARIIRTDKEEPALGVGILSGRTRLGNVEITRDSQGFITQIKITQDRVTRILTINRDSQKRIISITESIS
jgi:hypothetical protein